MAKFREMDEKLWEEWVETRPPVIQEMCRKYRPGTLYKMKSTGQRVYLLSYAEDKTVTVAVTRDFNFVIYDRNVFGVDINDLEECDLPEESEPLGSII